MGNATGNGVANIVLSALNAAGNITVIKNSLGEVGGGNLNTTSAPIIPYALGGNTTTDTGSNFVTYDPGSGDSGNVTNAGVNGYGIRLLKTGNETVTTNTAGANYRSNTPNANFNSVFMTGTATLEDIGGSANTIASGAIATNVASMGYTAQGSSGTQGFTTGGSQPLIIFVTPGISFQFGGSLRSTTTGGLVTTGGGTVALWHNGNSNNAYTGGTYIDTGVLNDGPNGADPADIQGNITFAGGTLLYTGNLTITNNMTVTANATGSIDGNATTRTLTYNTGTITVNSGATFAPTANITIAGNGTLTGCGTVNVTTAHDTTGDFTAQYNPNSSTNRTSSLGNLTVNFADGGQPNRGRPYLRQLDVFQHGGRRRMRPPPPSP